jgi:hypothetical protein
MGIETSNDTYHSNSAAERRKSNKYPNRKKTTPTTYCDIDRSTWRKQRLGNGNGAKGAACTMMCLLM